MNMFRLHDIRPIEHGIYDEGATTHPIGTDGPLVWVERNLFLFFRDPRYQYGRVGELHTLVRAKCLQSS